MSLKKFIKSNFSYDVSDLSAYVDEQRNELLTRQVTEARTLQLINIQTGIKHAEKLKLVDDSIIYQDGGCGMTPQGDTVFSDRTITVETLGYMKEFCDKDLAGFWTQLGLRAGAMAEDKELPFQQQLINFILSKHALELDKLIWKGDKNLIGGNLSKMDGFNKLLNVGDGCIDLNTSSATSITSSNAYELFYDAYLAMQASNADLAESTEGKFFCGVETLSKLRKNMIDLNFFSNTPDANALTQPLFGTSKIIEAVPGLNGTSRITFAKTNELVFGTDLSSDFDNFELWYSQDDDKLYMRSKFRAGVQVPFLNQIGVFEPVED